ncbi:MAG TPA: tetratricopeptide repeat protein [Myxococcota bacterium]
MPRRLLPLVTGLGLAAATLAAYHGVLANDFVNYDDDLYLTKVDAVKSGLTLPGVGWAFTTFHGANWFPLTWLSWMLDAQLYGLSPRGFHATSLALHVANVLLALLAFTRLTGSLGVGAFTAGVFALHPLHVESVAWAAARKDVLSGFFWMLALIGYERWARRGASPLRGAAVALAFVCGLLAKPVVVALPCVLLLLDAWPLRRLEAEQGGWAPARVRRALLEKLPLLAIAALFSALVVVAQRAGGALPLEDIVPLAARVGNAVVAYATYLRRALLPNDLAVFYPHPGAALGIGPVAGAAAILLGVSALFWLQRRRRPELLVGWLWWGVVLAPAIGIVQVGQAAMADRYTYLAQSGLVLALAATAAPLAARSRPARLAAGALALAVLLALGVATAQQVRVWRSSQTLFEHALRVTRNNHVAHINLGLVRLESRDLRDAAVHLSAALRIAPGSAVAHALLGTVRFEQGRAAEAAAEFERALSAAGPGDDQATWFWGLAAAQLAVGQGPQAVASLERAVALQPGSAPLHAHLARALASQGRLADAIARLDEALRLEPGNPELTVLRAVLLERAGRTSEAIAAYREALRLGSQAPDLRNNLAFLLATTGSGDLAVVAEAVQLAEQAVAQLGENPVALATLATAYAAAGRSEEAARTAQRAIAVAESGGNAELAAQIRERLALYIE